MDEFINATDLMTDEELIEVLQQRFDHSIFAGIKKRKKDDIEITRDWSGDEFTCKGIAIGIIESINDDLHGDA